jgi:acyl-CoA reductase-like NAD-dependent aldehyde dehydrogenase
MAGRWVEKANGLSLIVRDFVDGRWKHEPTELSLEKRGPRDGRPLYRLPKGNHAALECAVEAARASFDDGRWSDLTVARRKEVLFKLAVLVESNLEELALLESLDVGKPIHDALTVDLPLCIAWIRFYAEAADKFHGKVYGVDRSNLSYELRRPVGVVGGIVGWNFPLVLATLKIAPALATGNSLVLKPSEWTSLSTARFAELAIEAGVPPGVLNIVHGDRDLGAAIAHHPNIDLLSFTGSSRTGRALLAAAGESNMKRLLLECGGKAPNIVFEDCPDVEAVAAAVVTSAFGNQGEVCVASSRLLVQASIAAELQERINAKLGALTAGDPLDSATRYGALVSREHLEKVTGYVEGATREGARLAFRGRVTAPVTGGFYLAPHVFDQVRSEHRLAQEEVFGPVLAVLSFKDEAEAVRIANDTLYGLSAIVWTKDLARGHRVAHAIRAGLVQVYTTAESRGGPSETVLAVGGHKQSGIGVEGGLSGLAAYTTSTAVQYFI